MIRPSSFLIFVIAGFVAASSSGWAEDASPAYSWTLPKSILDVSITYEYAGCVYVGGGKEYKIKVTPIVTPRGVPDPVPGLRTQSTGALHARWQDRNLTITTFANSHILNSVSAHPVGRGAEIIGNVLSGVGKIVGIGFGGMGAIPSLDVGDCPDDNTNPSHQINGYKKDIRKAQEKLAAGNVSDSQQKQYTSQIQALQALLQQEQARMSFTIKATIDPGYTDPQSVEVGSDAPPAVPFPSQPPYGSPKLGAIPRSGLIASLLPTPTQMKDVPWITNPIRDPIVARLGVNIYMDFTHSIPPKQAEGAFYLPTNVDTNVDSDKDAITYRDVAYVPVLVWLGKKDDPEAQLLANTTLAFAQYGQAQVLPLSSSAFSDVNWSITFSELGEETKSDFTSKSMYQNASALFNPAASAASSVATELRSSSTNQATALQNQADEIYQRNRLAICQANPANCPSK